MTIIHLLFLLVFTFRHSDAQGANYVRYDNYSAVDFDNIGGSFAPNVYYCLIQSSAAPLVNGVVYNDATKVCKLLTATNNEVLVKVHVNAGWTTYVKNITSQYRIIFKIDGSFSTSTSNTGVDQLFTGSMTTYTTTFSSNVSTFVKGESCGCSYRNPIIDNWGSNIKFIKLDYVKDQLTMASLTFSASGSTSVSWFALSNVVASSPYNAAAFRMQTGFSINLASYTDGSRARSFSIMGNGGGCNDYYYILASNTFLCYYEGSQGSLIPKLWFTASIPASNSGGTGSLLADFMVISATFYDRVTIFQPNPA